MSKLYEIAFVEKTKLKNCRTQRFNRRWEKIVTTMQPKSAGLVEPRAAAILQKATYLDQFYLQAFCKLDLRSMTRLALPVERSI
jgi:hypothetical protein